MRPKINVLEEINGRIHCVTREMTEEEFAEYQEMIKMAEETAEV